MKALLDFLSLPLSLPINPIWEFVIMAVISEIALRIAFNLAGEYGSTSGERYAIHWILRFILYFGLWALACVIITITTFIKAHWVWSVAIGIILLITAVLLLIKHRKEHNAN